MVKNAFRRDGSSGLPRPSKKPARNGDRGAGGVCGLINFTSPTVLLIYLLCPRFSYEDCLGHRRFPLAVPLAGQPSMEMAVNMSEMLFAGIGLAPDDLENGYT